MKKILIIGLFTALLTSCEKIAIEKLEKLEGSFCGTMTAKTGEELLFTQEDIVVTMKCIGDNYYDYKMENYTMEGELDLVSEAVLIAQKNYNGVRYWSNIIPKFNGKPFRTKIYVQKGESCGITMSITFSDYYAPTVVTFEGN